MTSNTDQTRMDSDRLAHLLAAYGADPERWPEADRARREATPARLDDDPALARRRDEAAALDALLDQVTAIAPSPELLARVLADADRPGFWPQLAITLWPFAAPWRPAAALALSAFLGLAAGLLPPAAGEAPIVVAQLTVETEMEQLFLATEFDSEAIQ